MVRIRRSRLLFIITIKSKSEPDITVPSLRSAGAPGGMPGLGVGRVRRKRGSPRPRSRFNTTALVL